MVSWVQSSPGSLGSRGWESLIPRLVGNTLTWGWRQWLGRVWGQSHQKPSLSHLSARPWHRPWTRCLKSSWEKPLPARASGQQPPTPPAPGPTARSLQAAAALARTKPPEASRPQRGQPRPQHRSPRAWTHPSSCTEVLPALLWAPPHLRQPLVRRATVPRPFASPWPRPASTEHLLLTFCREEDIATQIWPCPPPALAYTPLGGSPGRRLGAGPSLALL